MMSSDKPWALRDVRIIDLTWIQVGPQATRLLASFGAQIIRVECPNPSGMDVVRQVPPFTPNHATPDGGRSQGAAPSKGIPGNFNRSSLFNNTNAGKYGVTLNLNHAKGRDLLNVWSSAPMSFVRTLVRAKWRSGVSPTTTCAR